MNLGATAWLHHVSVSLCGCTATPAGEARPRLYQASAFARVSRGPRSRRTLGGRFFSCPPQSACPAGAPVTRTRTCPGTKERRRKGSGARPEVGKKTRLVQDEVEAGWRGSEEGREPGNQAGQSRTVSAAALETPGGSWRPLAASGAARVPETIPTASLASGAPKPGLRRGVRRCLSSNKPDRLGAPRTRSVLGVVMDRGDPGEGRLGLERWRQEGPRPTSGPKSLPARALVDPEYFRFIWDLFSK